jgi:hypothetical protein
VDARQGEPSCSNKTSRRFDEDAMVLDANLRDGEINEMLRFLLFACLCNGDSCPMSYSYYNEPTRLKESRGLP